MSEKIYASAGDGAITQAYGEIRGRIATGPGEIKQCTGGFNVKIFDPLIPGGATVLCKAPVGLDERIPALPIGTLAHVAGLIWRSCGYVFFVSDVTDIIPIEEQAPGAWREAFGCAPAQN